MKPMGRPNTAKRCIVTTVLLCIIIVTFFVVRNGQPQGYGRTQSGQKIEQDKKRFVQLSADIQSRIKTLALFIGYPRSGHTLVGSLLDAHPHIIISNELNIFQRWMEWTKEGRTRANLINKMYENSYNQSLGDGYRSMTKAYGRKYAVPNQWHGKYKDYIKVIGDKKGGRTTAFLAKMPEVVKEIEDEMKLPMKLVHIVRNPYDNIATMLHRSMNIKTYQALAAKNKTNNTKALAYNVNVYLTHVKRNSRLLHLYGSKVLTLHSEDIIGNPKEALKKLCKFFSVTCTEDYINDCASIIYKNPSRTRQTVVWTPALKQEVKKATKKFPFLKRYTFES